MKAKLYRIGQQSWIKSLWMFLLSTVIGIVGDAIMQAFTVGSYSLGAIHWKEIGAAILVAVITYLKKEFITNSKGEILTKENEKTV